MSIFGGASAQSRTRNLLEFKAGKMVLRSNMVHPDKRKGLVYIYQSNDTLMHFCWKDRSSNAPHPEDDLVIFPQEVEFKKVTQNTTGRVYILKWRMTNRKFFFWMQEPKEDKDDELCKKVNELLNHPPVAGLSDGASRAHHLQPLLDQLTGSAGGLSPDLSSALQGLNPADLASLFSSIGQGMGGPGGHLQERSNRQSGDSRPNTAPAGTRFLPMSSSTSAATAATTRVTATSSRARDGQGSSSASSTTNPPSATTNKPKTAGNIQMSALTNVLSTLAHSSTPNQTTTTSEPAPTVDLNEIFTPESLIPLLSNKNVQEKLRPHLPEGYNLPVNENEFRDIISSAQFRQAVSAFSLALQSGQLAPVLTQFQFPTEVIEAANRGDVQAFARELEKHSKNSQTETKSNDPSMDTN